MFLTKNANETFRYMIKNLSQKSQASILLIKQCVLLPTVCQIIKEYLEFIKKNYRQLDFYGIVLLGHAFSNTTQHNTTQHNTTQWNATQQSTAQHSTTQHSTTEKKKANNIN